MLTYLVTGLGGPAGHNTAALLKARQAHVIGTDMRAVSVDATPCYVVPPANTPEFLPRLAALAQALQVDVLIPTVQEELPHVAERWHLHSPIPALIAPFKAVQLAHDKYLTCQTLEAAGVNVPAFALPTQLRSTAEVVCKLGWTYISKPRVGRGGRGVRVYDEASLDAMLALHDDVVLQAFASGTEYDVNAFISKTGRHAESIAVVLEKTELREGQTGNAVQVRRAHAPNIAELALAAGRALGLTGPFDVDVRRMADGTPVILEINARFGANIAHAPEVLEAALDGLDGLNAMPLPTRMEAA